MELVKSQLHQPFFPHRQASKIRMKLVKSQLHQPLFLHRQSSKTRMKLVESQLQQPLFLHRQALTTRLEQFNRQTFRRVVSIKFLIVNVMDVERRLFFQINFVT